MKNPIGYGCALALLGCTALSAGCSSTPVPEGYVAKQWATAFRELQITPVFPPREDVQVGDIYVVPVAPEDEKAVFRDKGYLPRGMWVHTLDLNKQISGFYKERPSFPQTNVERVEIFKSTWERIKDSSSDDIRRYTENFLEYIDSVNRAYPALPQPVSKSDLWESGGDANRLRIVGFPEFMSATFTQGNLSAFFPTESGSTGGQAMFSTARSVTVKVPVAESYGLPMSIFLPALQQQAEYDQSTWRRLGLSPNDAPHSPFDHVDVFLPAEQRGRSIDANGNIVVRLRVATEVYYARVLDITIEATKEAAAAIQVADGESAASGGGGGGGGGQAPSGGGGQSDEDDEQVAPDPNAELRAARLEARLAALEKDKERVPEGGLPGGSARVLSVSQNHIGMRRVFDRPVAIGFRGFDFEVALNARTGKFVSLKLLGITESMMPRGDE